MIRSVRWIVVCLAVGAACTATKPPAAGSDAGAWDAGPGDAGAWADAGTAVPDSGSGSGDASWIDPFAPVPEPNEGLTDVSADLGALLEDGGLVGACDAYRAGQTDRRTELLCGKWMFFYETFNTQGVPAVLTKFLAQNFPNELGPGFQKLGLVPDPSSPDSLPLGMAPTVPIGDAGVPALAFTCASCHFAQLPDGRYAVGAPNHRYAYGTHILSLTLVASLASGLTQPSAHDPAAVAAVQPILDRLNANPLLKGELLLSLLSLTSLKQPALSLDVEHAYATWPSGTLDFVIAPLPVDDGVTIVGKMIALWDIPTPAEVSSSGMANGMLAWTGAVPDLGTFLGGFAIFGGAPVPPAAQLQPLIDYVTSLRAPANPSPPDPALVSAGQALFVSKNCAACHSGPRGSGKRVYTFTEMGTDPTLQEWLDPNLTGQPCCGISPSMVTLTHGVKSPRMTGMWTLGRFLHNGSLSSLDELFCRGAGRPPSLLAPEANTGHSMTCDGLTDAEKSALIAYLLSH